MTKEQKLQIEKLRRAGVGYKQIANEIGISANSVKTFCRRNSLCEKHLQGTTEGSCEQCGKPVQILPKRKKKRFCSDRCRCAWWNSHQELVKRKAVYEYNCPVCGKEFTVYGDSTRKYCSHACYIEGRFGGNRHE